MKRLGMLLFTLLMLLPVVLIRAQESALPLPLLGQRFPAAFYQGV
jgi:hypothetical protein